MLAETAGKLHKKSVLPMIAASSPGRSSVAREGPILSACLLEGKTSALSEAKLDWWFVLPVET